MARNRRATDTDAEYQLLVKRERRQPTKKELIALLWLLSALVAFFIGYGLGAV